MLPASAAALTLDTHHALLKNQNQAWWASLAASWC
jgi:hypothetical protein